MKTRNLAIVFTDIKGFTARTSQQTWEENRRMLRLHDALLMPVFRAFAGRMVKTLGDAFLVVFESPTQAVLCGVAIQDRLWDYNRRVGEAEQIHVRVAINMGEVRLEKGDVFGEPVNIAARVEALADAGEVLFTEAVHLAMNKAEVPAEDRGEHELKGIPEKVRVWRVPRGAYRLGAAEAAPPPAPSSAEVGPPYGGLALARIADLPAPEPSSLLAAGDLKELGHLLATGAAQGARSASARAKQAWLGLPFKARLAASFGLAVLCMLGVGFATCGGNPVEAALARGDLKGAEAALRDVKAGADRTFLEGRIDEAGKRWEQAARHYEDASRAGKRAAVKRLLEMTRAEACGARARAASALGRLGDASALPALQTLERASFADEGGGNVFRELFGCSSKRAASEAIRAIQRADAG
jgi:adenylate cyclase